MTPSPGEETVEAGRQVALYVTELETRQPLTVGEDYLVRKQRADDFAAHQLAKWNDILEREKAPASDTGDDLNKHVQRLLSKWKAFQDDCLSEQHRRELTHESPDVHSVGRVIQQLTVAYQTSHTDLSTESGVVVRSLRRMGQGLHAHKTMLQIVPSGNNYAAIICGVVQTLIKVCSFLEGMLWANVANRLQQTTIGSRTPSLARYLRSTITSTAVRLCWISTPTSECIA